MRLTSISISSYRSCLHTKVPLHPQLTALIGINGAGKSNILNGLLLLRKLCRQRPYGAPPGRDAAFNRCRLKVQITSEDLLLGMRGEVFYESDERNSDEILDSRLEWNLPSAEHDSAWTQFPIEAVALMGQHPVLMNFPHRLLGAPAKKMTTQSLADWEHQVQKMHPVLSRIVAFYNGINYYSASQFADPSRCPVSIELDEGRPVRRVRQIFGHDQFILDLYKSFKAAGTQLRRYINTLGPAGIGLIDDIGFDEFEMPSSSYEVKSGGKIRKIDKTRLLIVPHFVIDGTRLSPNQLSEGTFKTLALLFYVLTDDSRLLLIEEPEVCIHHGLLSSIVTLIKTQSKTKQIVISTHSDFVLDHLAPENLVLVKREDHGGTKATALSKHMSRNDFRALREYLRDSGNLGDYWKEGGLDNA